MRAERRKHSKHPIVTPLCQIIRDAFFLTFWAQSSQSFCPCTGHTLPSIIGAPEAPGSGGEHQRRWAGGRADAVVCPKHIQQRHATHCSADLVLKVDRLPQPGETLGAESLQFFPGGKGANQAAAAAKLGWPTYMVGQLGSDSNADALEAALTAAGVQLQHVQRIEGQPSGTAMILLQDSGGQLAGY